MYGMNNRLKREIKTLQENSIEEYGRLNYEHWDRRIEKVNSTKSSDPEFWEQIRKSKGSNNQIGIYQLNKMRKN